MTMRISATLLALALVATLAGSPAFAGGGAEFHGLVLEVRVEGCEAKPGTCWGSVVIGYCEAGVLKVRVEPEATTIRRGDRRLELEELGYGDKVLALLQDPLPPEETPGYIREGGLTTLIEVR